MLGAHLRPARVALSQLFRVRLAGHCSMVLFQRTGFQSVATCARPVHVNLDQHSYGMTSQQLESTHLSART